MSGRPERARPNSLATMGATMYVLGLVAMVPYEIVTLMAKSLLNVELLLTAKGRQLRRVHHTSANPESKSNY